jgi:hypothetical protein
LTTRMASHAGGRPQGIAPTDTLADLSRESSSSAVRTVNRCLRCFMKKFSHKHAGQHYKNFIKRSTSARHGPALRDGLVDAADHPESLFYRISPGSR